MRGRSQQVIAQPAAFGHARRHGLHQPEADRLDHHPEPPDQEAAQHSAPVVAGAADNDHHPDQEGKAQRLVGAGRQLAVERRHHRAGDSAHRRAQHEDLQVTGLHVLAHRLGRDLVVADRAHHPTPRGVQRALRHPHQDRQHDQEQGGIEQLHHDRGRGDRVGPDRHHPVDEGRGLLQVDLVGHRAGQADHVLHAARQPVLVLEHGNDDLGDPERRDGEVVRAQAKRGLANDPGRARGKDAAHRPAQNDGQAKPPEVAGRGRIDGLDRAAGRVEDHPVKHEATEKNHEDDQCPKSALRQFRPGQDGCHDGRRTADQPQQEADPAGGPGLAHRRHRGQHRGKAAERDEAHDPDVEEARVAPLHVHAERHDRADQSHVDDRQRDVPRLEEAGQDDEQTDEGEEADGPEIERHTDFPRKRPVGRKRSTITRIMKLTANL